MKRYKILNNKTGKIEYIEEGNLRYIHLNNSLSKIIEVIGEVDENNNIIQKPIEHQPKKIDLNINEDIVAVPKDLIIPKCSMTRIADEDVEEVNIEQFEADVKAEIKAEAEPKAEVKEPVKTIKKTIKKTKHYGKKK